MKITRPVAMLLALLLCWGQLSYASNGAEMMPDVRAADMVMMSMGCGDNCDQVVEPCQNTACTAEHLCSGGSAFMVPVLMVSLVQGASNVSPPQPDHYRYCFATAIEHPPRIAV